MEKNAYDKMKQLLKWNDENIRMKMVAKEQSRVALHTAHQRCGTKHKRDTQPSKETARIGANPPRPAAEPSARIPVTRSPHPKPATRTSFLAPPQSGRSHSPHTPTPN